MCNRPTSTPREGGKENQNKRGIRSRKHTQKGEKNLLNSFLKLLKTVRYEPNLLFTCSQASKPKGEEKL